MLQTLEVAARGARRERGGQRLGPRCEPVATRAEGDPQRPAPRIRSETPQRLLGLRQLGLPALVGKLALEVAELVRGQARVSARALEDDNSGAKGAR